MDVTWPWKLPILLIVTCPLLGCDVLRFGAQCQDHYRCSNDSLYATCSIENESNINERNSRHGLNALGRFPHDVKCTGQRLSLGEMEFTNIFNTCPANETVGNLPCDDIISGITGTTTIEPDLGYTFVLDVLGACFNVTVIEVNGKRIDYGKIIKKLKFEFTQMKTNRTELDENYDRNVMSVEIPSEFVVEIIENNTRLFNVKEFTNNGLCDWLRDWRGKGCDVRWFRSDCQDNYRCSNESWYKRDSVVSHCEDDRKLDARCLSCFPHDVIRTENEEGLNMSRTNFTKNLNTCPVKESVEFMCFDNIANRSTNNGTTKPDLVYTFQVDQSGKVISVCFILIREKTDKAKILLNVTETNDKELGLALTSDADEMKLYIQPGYIIIISDTYPLFYNFTGVTLAGSFEKFRVGKKDAQDFNLKNCDRSGKCFDWNEKRIIRVILIIVDLKETSIAVIGVTIFIATVYFLNFWQRRRRLNQFVLNLQQQIAAFQQQAAPAG